ncbi:hypothetical protein ACS0TY_031816 [Phlomoides rotata]
MRLRRKSLGRERVGIQAICPVVWYVVGLVRPAKTALKERKRCVPHSRRTTSDILEEGGDDVKSAWPLWAGPHTCYNGNYNGKQGCKAERIRKDCLSSDCSLQLGNMKLESLVIADQHAAVNMYTGPVHTARHTLPFARLSYQLRFVLEATASASDGMSDSSGILISLCSGRPSLSFARSDQSLPECLEPTSLWLYYRSHQEFSKERCMRQLSNPWSNRRKQITDLALAEKIKKGE